MLYNDLVLGLYNGGYLSRDLRRRSQDALNGHGRGGYAVDLSVDMSWGERFFGRRGWRPRIGVAHHSFLGLRFRDPVFDLTFFGNAAYEGRTARLGPSAFEQVDYQVLAFGAEQVRTRSYVQVAVVNGQRLNAGDIRRADLFTAVDGRYLDLDLDGRYWRNDTVATTDLGSSNGLGAAVQFGITLPVQIGRLAGEVGVSAADLGFIRWNGNSLRLPKDSSLHYTGLRVPDVLDLDGLITSGRSFQDTLGLTYGQGAFTRLLPFRVEGHLALGRLRSSSLRDVRAYTLAVDHRHLAGYVPFASLRRTFRLGRDAAVHVQVDAGGFGGLRAGAGVKVRLAKHFLLSVETPNAVGTASGTARGKAVLAGLDVEW